MRPVHILGVGTVLFAAAATLVILARSEATSALSARAFEPSDVAAFTEAGVMDDATMVEEQDFLQIDLDPQPDLSGITPLESPENVPYRHCEKPEDLKAVLLQPGSQLYARRRDMSAYLRMMNVLATRDCLCSGKLVPASSILAFEKKLMAEAGVARAEDLVTRPLYDEARKLRRRVEYLCGGES